MALLTDLLTQTQNARQNVENVNVELLLREYLAYYLVNTISGGSGGGGSLSQAQVEAALNNQGLSPTLAIRLTDIATSSQGTEIDVDSILLDTNAMAVSTASVDSKLTTSNTRLTEIRNLLGNNKFEYFTALDANNVFVVGRVDRQGSTIDYFDAAGSPFTPVLPLKLNTDNASSNSIVLTSYEAITTVAGQWSPQDILTRMLVVDSMGAAIGTTWFLQNGAVATTTPVVGVDVTVDRRIELDSLRTLQAIALGGNTLLSQIQTLVDSLEPGLGNPSDSASDTGSLNAKVRQVLLDLAIVIASLAAVTTSLGQPTETPTATATDNGSLIAVLKGLWAHLEASTDLNGPVADTIRVGNVTRPVTSVTGSGVGVSTIGSTPAISQLSCANATGTVLFLQMHTAVPTAGAVPSNLFGVLRIPANSSLALGADYFGPGGTSYGTNVWLALSSTLAVYTPVAGTNLSLSATRYS